MELSGYELFIFDFDGTLSTPTLIVRALRFFKRRYNIDFIKAHEDRFNKELNVELRDKKIEKSESLYSRMYSIYSIFFKPKMKKGAVEVLEELKKRKKKIALFSDGMDDRVRKELAALGIEEYFDIVLCADSIGIFKPNPTPLILILRNMKVPKEKAVYIGDMGVDVLTARFAGISSCVVSDGLGSLKTLKEAGPDFLFANLHEILEELKKEEAQ